MLEEDQLGALLRRAVATVDTDVEPLVAGGLRRGRRRLAVRRGLEGLTALTVAGALAVTGVLTFGSSPSPSPQTLAVPAGNAGPSDSASPTPTAEPMAPITPQVAVQTAIDLLPRPGTISQLAGRSLAGTWLGGEFVYDDGNGAAPITVSVTAPGSAAVYPSDPEGPGLPCPPGGTATCSTLPDGARIAIFQGTQFPDGHKPYNATQWAVWLLRTDGLLIQLTEWNSSQQTDAPLTRAEPPFTAAELTAMARSPRWSLTVPQSAVDAAAGLFTADSR
jgi:hypothetical protein